MPKSTRADDLMASDIQMVVEATEDVLTSLRGSHIFLTGGTGFIGTWLLEALRHADMTLGLWL